MTPPQRKLRSVPPVPDKTLPMADAPSAVVEIPRSADAVSVVRAVAVDSPVPAATVVLSNAPAAAASAKSAGFGKSKHPAS